jgi:hypothetical protein
MSTLPETKSAEMLTFSHYLRTGERLTGEAARAFVETKARADERVRLLKSAESALFSHYLRTGERLHGEAAEHFLELKFNQRHYRENGQFARAGEGAYFGGGTADVVLAASSHHSRATAAQPRGTSAVSTVRLLTDHRRSSALVANSDLNPANVSSVAPQAGGRVVHPAIRSLHDPEGLRKFPDRVEYVFQRSFIYESLDEALQSQGSSYRSNFFHAAAQVTATRGLTGAQGESAVADSAGRPGLAFYDRTTLRNVQRLGADLYQHINVPLFRALYHGNANFRLVGGQTIGTLVQRGTLALDYAIIHHEQSYVQAFLNRLTLAERKAFVEQSNALLLDHRFMTPPIESAMKNLGHRFNFANQFDREAIGRAELKR